MGQDVEGGTQAKREIKKIKSDHSVVSFDF